VAFFLLCSGALFDFKKDRLATMYAKIRSYVGFRSIEMQGKCPETSFDGGSGLRSGHVFQLICFLQMAIGFLHDNIGLSESDSGLGPS